MCSFDSNRGYILECCNRASRFAMRAGCIHDNKGTLGELEALSSIPQSYLWLPQFPVKFLRLCFRLLSNPTLSAIFPL